MALFKAMVGANKTTLDNQPKHAGYCWFTTEDGKLYIDWESEKDTTDPNKIFRTVLNAGYADTSASCTGNAATATKATLDGDGKVISSTYFKKSGGTLNGQIKFQTQSTQGHAEVVKNHLENADYGFLLRDVNSAGVKAAIQISANSDKAYYIDNAGIGYPILTEKNAVTIAQGGTGATTAAAARTALGITPANIGAVKKAGDTMTGDLKLGALDSTDAVYLRSQRLVGEDAYASRFYTKGDNGAASIQSMKNDTTVNYMYLEEERTVFKKPVNIGSGGTGATTAADARTNLKACGYTTVSNLSVNDFTATAYLPLTGGTLSGQLTLQAALSGTSAVFSGNITADTVNGAVWNDYAEYRTIDASAPAGYCVVEKGNDELTVSTRRLEPGAYIVSDTFGFSIGKTSKARCPVAVSGRVLAYPFEDRDSYKPGDPVCAAPGGRISKMTRKEAASFPDRMIGIVSAIPDYETWGENKVKVDGRIWIKVK